MIGRHPQMYGFPEVNLFLTETMAEREGVVAEIPFLDHGLLRAVAQLYTGAQNVRTVALAKKWVAVRRSASCVPVFRELMVKINPKQAVDKSITTVLTCERLQRAHRAFPNARFLHLLRHPLGQGESLWRGAGQVAAERLGALDYSTDPPTVDYQKSWYAMHINILTLLNGLPKSQYMRLQGEALLASPDTHLRSIARWLGLRVDAQVVEAMKHPELSPYAFLGPPNALFGNDPKFLQNPALRSSSGPKALTLEGPLPWRNDGVGFSEEVKQLAREFGYH